MTIVYIIFNEKLFSVGDWNDITRLYKENYPSKDSGAARNDIGYKCSIDL